MNNEEMFSIGQRWISAMEPELGVGIVTEISNRMVRIVFPAAETERQYAIATAPLKRLQFNVGDTIQTRDGAWGNPRIPRKPTLSGSAQGGVSSRTPPHR